MLKQRKGSVFAFAIALTAVFLTMVVGTMAYFEAANRQANSEKWRDVAEQAARSGLDLVMGWGESHLDRESKLPTAWETDDGKVIDPVSTFGATQANTVLPLFTSTNDAIANADPVGGRLGSQVSEYILSRVGNYVVTFKARVQQFRMSEDAPRQYRIGVAGRVRKVMPGNVVQVDTNEKAGIVSERLLVATIGKEPFSRYAALIDIDVVKNWVPGEVIQGPVHINRGYVDIMATPANMQANNATFKDRRSKMLIHTTSGTGGFEAINGRQTPLFQERVSMTIMNDGAQPLSDDNVSDADPAAPNRRYSSAIEVNNTTGTPSHPGAASGVLANIFIHPDNFGALGGITGPVIMPSPVPFPPNSRQRIPTALGLPPGVSPNGVNWYLFKTGPTTRNPDTLPDGLYVPTVEWVTTAARRTLPANTLSYAFGDDRPAGGIYLRGNVEEMRMTVNGTISYYLVQMGYGAPRGDSTVRRVYMVRADRQNRQLTLRAFPRNLSAYLTSNASRAPGSSLALGTRQDCWANPDALRELLEAVPGNVGPERYFATSPGTANAAVSAWNVAAGGDISIALDPILVNQGNFPFNGVFFVDASSHDPLNLVTNINGTVQAGVPITGNIFALGDKEPTNKMRVFPSVNTTVERVCTNAPPLPTGGVPPASKLTIVAAGSIFIQNSIMLEDLRTNGTLGTDPQGDNITLGLTRDLLGIVADRQVVIGLAAPRQARNSALPGCVVHAAVAALRDPDATSSGTINYASGVPAYWGSFVTEGLQPLFANSAIERYQVVRTNGLPGGFFGAGAKWDPLAVYPTEKGMPGVPIYAHSDYNAIIQNATNPNKTERGRLVMFGSVTQFKRGAVGAGNRSYDKDFRYDKRLMSIAPPVFPASTSIGLRVTAMYAPGDQPYRPAVSSATNRDLNFMGVGALNAPAMPAP